MTGECVTLPQPQHQPLALIVPAVPRLGAEYAVYLQTVTDVNAPTPVLQVGVIIAAMVSMIRVVVVLPHHHQPQPQHLLAVAEHAMILFIARPV